MNAKHNFTNSKIRVNKRRSLKRASVKADRLSNKYVGGQFALDSFTRDRRRFSKLLRLSSLNNYILRNIDEFDESALVFLNRHLRNVDKGSNFDVETPLGGYIKKFHNFQNERKDSISRSSAVKLIDDFLESSETYSEILGLKDYEESQRVKVGSYSIRRPWVSKLNQVDGYFLPVKSNLDLSILERSKDKMKQIIGSGLSPDSLETTTRSSRKNTNWGLKYCLRGNSKHKDKYVWEYHYERAKQVLKSREFPKAIDFVVERVQIGGDEPKQRIAWATAHYTVLLELMFLRPLLDRLRERLSCFAEYISRTSSSSHITAILDSAIEGVKVPTGFDGEAFDKNTCREGLDAVYDVIDYVFSNNWTWLINGLKKCMCESDLITPSGVFTGRVDGVASGRGLTNIVDSLYQMLMSIYMCIKESLEWFESDYLYNGDDGIWSTLNMTLEMLISVCNDFGMPVNKDKLNRSCDFIIFCNRFYSKNYRDELGVCYYIRSAYRFIAHATGMERPKTNKFKSVNYSIRLIMQFEELIYHPIYEDVLKFCVLADTLHGLGTKWRGGPQRFIEQAGSGKLGGFETTVTLERASSWEIERARGRDEEMFSLEVIKSLNTLMVSV